MFQRERRVQVDLTLTRGVRNTTKRMLVNGQRPRSRAELAEALPLTVFTPEGVDVVRGGPEHRRDVSDEPSHRRRALDRRSRRTIRNGCSVSATRCCARSRAQRPTSSQQAELELWTSDFCDVAERARRRIA